MTGRGAGFCAGYDVPGYMNPAPGRGYGRGAGWGVGGGRGWRHWYYATGLPGWVRFGGMPMWGVPPAYAGPTPQQEMDMLKQQAQTLKAELDAINERIAAFGAQAAPDKEQE
jgi:hypothetical protein